MDRTLSLPHGLPRTDRLFCTTRVLRAATDGAARQVKEPSCGRHGAGPNIRSESVKTCCVSSMRTPTMSIGILLLIGVVLLFTAGLPAWPYSRDWGYRPSTSFGLVILMTLLLLATGRL
jgi:hypothetical protein